MPRTKGGVQQAIAEQDPDEEDEYAFEVGRRVRVWWPPTDAEDRTGYAGMYWPVKILEVNGNRVSVEYDNGEDEEVALEHLQPANPPVDFGKEAVHLQVGEFVEVFNESKTDPAAWLAKVHSAGNDHYVVTYPFHDTKNEKIKLHRLRRARLFERETRQWKIIAPDQVWDDGEIESPVELETMTARELARYFQRSKPAKSELKDAKAKSSRDEGQSQSSSAKKRKGNPQRAGQ